MEKLISYGTNTVHSMVTNVPYFLRSKVPYMVRFMDSMMTDAIMTMYLWPVLLSVRCHIWSVLRLVRCHIWSVL